jgi:hypothetical protein
MQLGLANGVSEEEMVAQVMAFTAEQEVAPDTGRARTRRCMLQLPPQLLLPHPHLRRLYRRPLQLQPQLRHQHLHLRRLWNPGCSGSKTVASPPPPPPLPPLTPGGGGESGPPRVRGAPQAALCRRRGGWEPLL